MLSWIYRNSNTGPDGTVAKSPANGLVGTGFASLNLRQHSWFLNPQLVCKRTASSSFSLTSKMVTTNY